MAERKEPSPVLNETKGSQAHSSNSSSSSSNSPSIEPLSSTDALTVLVFLGIMIWMFLELMTNLRLNRQRHISQQQCNCGEETVFTINALHPEEVNIRRQPRNSNYTAYIFLFLLIVLLIIMKNDDSTRNSRRNPRNPPGNISAEE